MARSIPGTCLLARALGNAIVLYTLCHYACFCYKKCLSVQLLTPFTTRCRRNNPANIRMQEKRRLARHHQHKASLVEEELRLDNAVIPDAPPTPPPATQPPPESPSLPPSPEANCAVRRLGIGDQQSAESTPLQALERSPSPAPSLLLHKSCGPPPTYRLRRHRPVRGRLARLVRGLHAAGPDLGNMHGLCLATPQHILPLMNAIGAAREGPLLKRKSLKRCPLTAQASDTPIKSLFFMIIFHYSNWFLCIIAYSFYWTVDLGV
jgi:hypothetical protein